MNGHEELLVRRGERSGYYVIVAVHSTVLGPALGGCRMWHYPSAGEGIDDALDLARAMTLKAAVAGLDLGGGKGVICASANGPLAGEARRDALLDFADAVESLDGRYVTAEDVGTTPDDMAVIATATSHVVGLPPRLGGLGDPSPLTARGVEAAIRACCERRFGTAELEGVGVCVVGLGHVGSRLARRLTAAGARLTVSDIDLSRAEVAAELGARWLQPGEALTTGCDVLAPCALGGAVDAVTAEEIRCAVLCGAANNLLADEAVAKRLAARGVLYAPDFVANAGGLIHVYADLHGLGPDRVGGMIDGIADTVDRVLTTAEGAGTTPLAAAYELADRRLRSAAGEESSEPMEAGAAEMQAPGMGH